MKLIPFWHCLVPSFISRTLDLTMKSIFQNGRRHITSSKNEVSRDLVVNVKSKKKQALLVDASSFFLICYIMLICSIYFGNLMAVPNQSCRPLKITILFSIDVLRRKLLVTMWHSKFKCFSLPLSLALGKLGRGSINKKI